VCSVARDDPIHYTKKKNGILIAANYEDPVENEFSSSFCVPHLHR
jgi:hypothetical protein